MLRWPGKWSAGRPETPKYSKSTKAGPDTEAGIDTGLDTGLDTEPDGTEERT